MTRAFQLFQFQFDFGGSVFFNTLSSYYNTSEIFDLYV